MKKGSNPPPPKQAVKPDPPPAPPQIVINPTTRSCTRALEYIDRYHDHKEWKVTILGETMDIEQVKKKKQETEVAVAKLINEFSAQTGATVQCVIVNGIDTRNTSNEQTGPYYTIELYVSL